MSNKHEALKLLAAGETLTNADIYNGLAGCDSASAVVVMMSWLKKDGLVEVAGKNGNQNQWRISDAGKKALEELNASGGGASVIRKKSMRGSGKLPRKVKSVKPRKKYKKRAKAKRRAIKTYRDVARAVDRRAKGAEPRWALTSDQAFIDLAAPERGEIPRPAAVALASFVRSLDEAAA